MVIQAFYPAQTSVSMDRKVARNPLLHIASTVIHKAIDKLTNMEQREKIPKYDIALSFAGEDRSYVESVARILKENGVKVFYDLYEEAELWGKDLYTHLRNVYQNEAKFTIVFVSEHYEKKLWTNHERQSVQARAFQENREYLLPARFDNTEIPGLPNTIGYVDLRKMSPSTLCELVKQKLEQFDSTNSFSKKHFLQNKDEDVPNGLYARFSFSCFQGDDYRGGNILIKPNEYKNLGELLDDIYINYLSNFFPPYSYGANWIITNHRFNILVPPDWVIHRGEPIYNINPNWIKYVTLEKLNIVVDSYFEIIGIKERPKNGMRWRDLPKVYAFGSNNKELVDLVLKNSKAIALLKQKGFISDTTVNEYDTTELKFKYVMDDWLSCSDKGALIGLDKSLPDELRNFFRY